MVKLEISINDILNVNPKLTDSRIGHSLAELLTRPNIAAKRLYRWINETEVSDDKYATKPTTIKAIVALTKLLGTQANSPTFFELKDGRRVNILAFKGIPSLFALYVHEKESGVDGHIKAHSATLIKAGDIAAKLFYKKSGASLVDG